MSVVDKNAKYEKRKKFQHQGQTIYEWEQDLEEINVYIRPPPGVTKAHLSIVMTCARLSVGIKGNPPFIDQEWCALIDKDASFWTLSDGEIVINCQKALVGETWDAALKGHGELGEVDKQQVQQKILLERFQREHPGFDFSQATFSGAAPNARTFMDGIDTNKI